MLSHPSRASALTLFVVALAVPVTTVDLTAQMRSALPGSELTWPTSPRHPGITGGSVDSPSGPAASIGISSLHQERPLPVYDDDGNVIRLSEIQAEVDASGAAGAFWGILVGVSVGSALGSLVAPGQCEEVRGGYRYYCSPREEALNSALPGAFAILLGTLGGWIGWESDRVTFDEALERIREGRRETVR